MALQAITSEKCSDAVLESLLVMKHNACVQHVGNSF
jgi:hypothetical protein